MLQTLLDMLRGISSSTIHHFRIIFGSKKTYNKSYKEVDEGFNDGIFPEGGIKTKKVPEMAEFKDGAFAIALKKRIIFEKPKIIPVSSDYFNMPAKRPSFSLLNCEKTYELFDFWPPHWRETINTLLDSFNDDFIKRL